MGRYQAYPQYPHIVITAAGIPDQVPLIRSAEQIVIGARDKHDKALRETCREFMDWYVDTSKPMPAGDVAWCSPCHAYKHVRDFYPDPSRKNGLQTRCRECEKKRKKRATLNKAMAQDGQSSTRIDKIP